MLVVGVLVVGGGAGGLAATWAHEDCGAEVGGADVGGGAAVTRLRQPGITSSTASIPQDTPQDRT